MFDAEYRRGVKHVSSVRGNKCPAPFVMLKVRGKLCVIMRTLIRTCYALPFLRCC